MIVVDVVYDLIWLCFGIRFDVDWDICWVECSVGMYEVKVFSFLRSGFLECFIWGWIEFDFYREVGRFVVFVYVDIYDIVIYMEMVLYY